MKLKNNSAYFSIKSYVVSDHLKSSTRGVSNEHKQHMDN